MTQYNDYKTPRERISGEFRRTLEGASPVFAAGNTGARFTPVQAKAASAESVCASRYGNTKNVSPSLAMVYSTEQEFGELYGEEEALTHGTLFKELDFPFEAAFCGMRKNLGGAKR